MFSGVKTSAQYSLAVDQSFPLAPSPLPRYICALFAYLNLLFTDPAYNKDGGYTTVILAFAFLIGLQFANVFTTPLSSGIDTIFVVVAWDPGVMWRDDLELYNEMFRVLLNCQVGLRGERGNNPNPGARS